MVGMRDIISKLVELTGQSRVPWKTGSDQTTFVAVYGDLSVLIHCIGAEPTETIFLTIFDDEATIIDRAIYYGSRAVKGLPGMESYDELKSLYESAKRCALGVDDRLTKLLERMDSSPPVRPT